MYLCSAKFNSLVVAEHCHIFLKKATTRMAIKKIYEFKWFSGNLM